MSNDARRILRNWARSNGYSPADINAADYGGQLAGVAFKHIKKAVGSRTPDSGVGQTPPRRPRVRVTKLNKFIGPKNQNPYLSQEKQSMPRQPTSKRAVSSLVTRSSMAVSGKTKLKKLKKVAVPKRLRKQIKQVMLGEAAKGSYTTIKSGYIGSVWGTASSGNVSFTDLNALFVGYAYNGGSQIAGRTLFNCLTSRVAAGLPTIVAGSGLNFFTPGKIVDAASVLFNKKVASNNPYNLVNNLSATFANATGVPQDRPGKLKINVLSSSVQFTMKNVSNRVVHVDIWECTPKLKFQDVPVLNNLLSFASENTENAVDQAFEYLVGPVTSTNSIEPYFNCSFDTMAIAKNEQGFKWVWKKRSMVLAPDETCIHTIKGPSGLLDYTTLMTGALTDAGAVDVTRYKLNAILKGFSVSCVMSVHGDQVLTGVGSGGRKQFAGNQSLSMPVSVEIMENYRIAVPEIAGFVDRNQLAGTTQMLNLRKPKKVIYDMQEQTQVAYEVSNEVNPLAFAVADANS